jgi:hypothetical protein
LYKTLFVPFVAIKYTIFPESNSRQQKQQKDKLEQKTLNSNWWENKTGKKYAFFLKKGIQNIFFLNCLVLVFIYYCDIEFLIVLIIFFSSCLVVSLLCKTVICCLFCMLQCNLIIFLLFYSLESFTFADIKQMLETPFKLHF